VKLRFLIDENQPRWLAAAVRRREPAIDVVRPGDAAGPPLEVPDQDILQYAEYAQRLIITGDLRSMPGHIAGHRAAGRHHWGVGSIRPGTPRAWLVDEIVLLWQASEAEEWFDQEAWLPL
jgi:hypothetical protein